MVAAALVSGLTVPALAQQQSTDDAALADGESLFALIQANAQHVEAPSSALASVAENGLAATTPEQLEEMQAAAQAAAAAAEAEAEAAAAAAASQSSDPVNIPPAIAGTAAGAALSMVGVPYRFGGASPSGFDCSGLTQWAYAQIGISLPHSANAQAAMGTQIPLSELQPGDLVYWYDLHVAMYIGDGQMVHAPYAGSVVSVVSVASMQNWGGGAVGIRI